MSLRKQTLVFLARSGYAARGVVYFLVGGLAFLAAIGAGGETTDGKGALQSLLDAPFGYVILTCIAAGLLGYALWRLVQALADADNHGRSIKALAIRFSLVVSAIFHVLLAVFIAKLLLSFGDTGNGDRSGLVNDLMTNLAGRAVLILAGCATVVAGFAHGYKGWTASFDRHFSVPSHLQSMLYPVCRIGLVCRGVVLVVVGCLLLLAVYQADASQAGGTERAFSWLQEQVFGNVLLAGIALGLVAFAAYSVIETRYRKVNLNR